MKDKNKSPKKKRVEREVTMDTILKAAVTVSPPRPPAPTSRKRVNAAKR